MPVRRCMCACGPSKLLSRDALEPRARASLDEREERRVGDEGGGRECLTQAVEGQPVKEARVSGQRERERGGSGLTRRYAGAYGPMALVGDEQRELENALARVAVLESELATVQGKPKKTDDLSNLEVLLSLLWCLSHIFIFSL